MAKGKPANIKPTKQRLDKAESGIDRAVRAGKISKKQGEALKKGIAKRRKAI